MKTLKSIIGAISSILLILVSCTKEKFDSNSTSDEIGIGLTVNIGGINEDLEKFSNASNSIQLNNLELTDLNELVSFDDFDAISSINELKLSSATKFINNDKNKIAARTPVKAGVKYYIVLFADNNGTRGSFIGSYLLTAGILKTISVETGKKYHWMAYSYNTSLDNLPTVNANNLNVSMGENKDFLFAEGTTSIINSHQPTYLSIIFNHMLARVGFEINARGMFTDKIEALDVDLAVDRVSVSSFLGKESETKVDFKVANFNLLNKSITESNVLYANNIKLFSFNKTDDIPKSDSVLTYVFLPPYANSQVRFSVKLNMLNIKLDNEADSVGDKEREFSYTSETAPTIFSERLNTFSQGKSKLLKVDLVESPLIINTRGRYEILGIPIVPFDYTVKWGRSNLYYEPKDTSYRFQHVNIQSKNRNSYFAFGSELPFEYGKNSDPCALVYPQGVWRMPNAADFYATIGGAVTNVNLLNILKVNLNLLGISVLGLDFPTPSSRNRTTSYVEYTPNGGNSSFYNSKLGADVNNKLRFNYNGFYLNTNLVENLIHLNLGDFNNVSRIWTSSANVGLLGSLAGVGAISYTGTFAMDYVDASPLNLLNIDLLGLNIAKTDLLNIRCVRNLEYSRKNNN